LRAYEYRGPLLRLSRPLSAEGVTRSDFGDKSKIGLLGNPSSVPSRFHFEAKRACSRCSIGAPNSEQRRIANAKRKIVQPSATRTAASLGSVGLPRRPPFHSIRIPTHRNRRHDAPPAAQPSQFDDAPGGRLPSTLWRGVASLPSGWHRRMEFKHTVWVSDGTCMQDSRILFRSAKPAGGNLAAHQVWDLATMEGNAGSLWGLRTSIPIRPRSI